MLFTFFVIIIKACLKQDIDLRVTVPGLKIQYQMLHEVMIMFGCRFWSQKDYVCWEGDHTPPVSFLGVPARDIQNDCTDIF